MFLVLGLFFGLKIPDYLEFIKNKNVTKKDACQFEELIQQLKESPEDQETNRKINSYLLHILNSIGGKI